MLISFFSGFGKNNSLSLVLRRVVLVGVLCFSIPVLAQNDTIDCTFPHLQKLHKSLMADLGNYKKFIKYSTQNFETNTISFQKWKQGVFRQEVYQMIGNHSPHTSRPAKREGICALRSGINTIPMKLWESIEMSLCESDILYNNITDVSKRYPDFDENMEQKFREKYKHYRYIFEKVLPFALWKELAVYYTGIPDEQYKKTYLMPLKGELTPDRIQWCSDPSSFFSSVSSDDDDEGGIGLPQHAIRYYDRCDSIEGGGSGDTADDGESESLFTRIFKGFFSWGDTIEKKQKQGVVRKLMSDQNELEALRVRKLQWSSEKACGIQLFRENVTTQGFDILRKQWKSFNAVNNAAIEKTKEIKTNIRVICNRQATNLSEATSRCNTATTR